MTVVGSDAFADAPFLTPGQSSAYTPNAGYTLESGEPTAWGGKTAWWRVTPTENAFIFLDVLHSTGSTRAWVYRADVPDPEFSDLLLLNAPAPDTQGGWSAGAGRTYWIRADSDGADVSYVVSIGAEEYDEVTERRSLTAPRNDGTFPSVRENHFSPGAEVSGPPAAWYYDLFDSLVDGGGAATAEMEVGAWASTVVAEWPAETGDPSWYGDNPDDHPIINYGVSSDGVDDVTAPTGYSLGTAQLAMTIWATDGPPLEAAVDGEVRHIQVDGSFDVLTPVFYLDENGSPAGDVPITTTPTEFLFDFPASPSPSDVELYYNDGSLLVHFRPNLVGTPGDPFPVGTWYVGGVAIDFLYISDDPLPYEPPGPPVVEIVSVVRNYPRRDGLGFATAQRNYPPTIARGYGDAP